MLEAWRAAADADQVQTTVRSLTRAQFNDHIPALLDAFEKKLRARPGGASAAAADEEKTREDVKHGLQRWQQGYQLSELMHEWGNLHLCLAKEVCFFAEQRPEVSQDTICAAHRELIGLISEGVNQSAGEYARLQQAEAAGHVQDLQQAFTKVAEIERRRGEWIHQAVHDLRTNVQSVSSAAAILGEREIAESERVEFATLVQQGVGAVADMLGDLMALARLEAGQERREIAIFDAAAVLGELCATMRAMAMERNLFLKVEGPTALRVEGDAGKVRRMIQNLLFNALKYTVQGGVTVSFGEEKESWWIIVKDTGPGLLGGPVSPMASRLNEATASARESEESAAVGGGKPTILPAAPDGIAPAPPRPQQSGEGIGLSIVKRLCELLDASLEMTSSAASGTSFRAVFPRKYQ